MMADKPRQRRCLSSSKRKGISKGSKGSAGTPTTTTTPPITSFFTNAAPPRLACPLCGQMVPRYSINEHIDLQCPQFEREGSGHVVSSSSSLAVEPQNIKLSPKINPTNTPEQHLASPPRDRSKDLETPTTSTSPYFKQPNTQQTPREVSRTVVRTLDLGSLSSKLSRSRRRCPPGRTQKHHDDDDVVVLEDEGSEALSSSQKENHLIQRLHNKECLTVTDHLVQRLHHKECLTVTEPTASSPVRNPAEHLQNGPEELHEEATIIIYPPVLSASSKLTKRKKVQASRSKTTAFSKRAREDERKRESPKREDERKRESPRREEERKRESPRREEETERERDKDDGQMKTSDNGSMPVMDSELTTDPYRTPYYLRNFQAVVDRVLDDEEDRRLFNQDDLSVINSFKKLSVTAQKLYVRLFQRKLKWLQVNKLDYEEISSDLGPVVLELVEGAFLQTEMELHDVREVLDLLAAPELKGLAKTFHLGASGSHKRDLVEGLVRLSTQKSLFSHSPGNNSIRAVILRRAKQLGGPCVRLHGNPRAVFCRLLLLFSLTDSMEDDERGAAGGQGQLWTMLLVNSGRLAFPVYSIQRRDRLFQDREELIRYEAAVHAQQEVRSSMQAGQWEESLELYCAAKSSWQLIRDTQDLSQQVALPVFLRCFTTGWVYTRILSRGVDILQRLRRYEEAVSELRSLLAQSVYCLDSRGRWWDRLALNLQQHLKLPEQAIQAIREGLRDPLVRTGHQLSLHQRAVRMKESPSFKKLRLQLKDLPTVTVQDVPHVTICGQLFPHEGGMGKNVFLMQPDEGADDATVMCSVEQLTLAHYRRQGFDQGIHGEGGTFSTLLGLLLWDVIFMEGVPDVFRNPYQTCPLDLFTDCFYDNRKEAFDTRVQVMEEACVETLCDMLEEVWRTHEGTMCSLVSWELFSSLQQAKSVVCCLGGVFLAGMMKRMMKDYRHCRGGLPDLMVWNSSSYIYKLVEVKGPSDRLSQKQQIWLDELSKLGAEVEVCHVTSQGARGACLE